LVGTGKPTQLVLVFFGLVKATIACFLPAAPFFWRMLLLFDSRALVLEVGTGWRSVVGTRTLPHQSSWGFGRIKWEVIGVLLPVAIAFP
jgi:hypothetical protein